MSFWGKKDDEDKKADEVVDEMLKSAQNKIKQEESRSKPMTEEDLMGLFDDCSDVEVMLMGDEAQGGVSEAIANLMESENFFDDELSQCISALHTLYIYKKVYNSRDIEGKNWGEFKKEYNELQEKWRKYNE